MFADIYEDLVGEGAEILSNCTEVSNDRISCYLFGNTTTEWTEVEDFCERRGASPVVINDYEELSFILAEIGTGNTSTCKITFTNSCKQLNMPEGCSII